MTETYSVQFSRYWGTGDFDFDTYTLSGYDATSGLTFQYLGDQGFGMAPLHRITTRGPLQYGDSDIDYRLDPRILQIPLIVQNTSSTPRYNVYAIRQKMLDIFRPQSRSILKVTTTATAQPTIAREIEVRTLGGLSFDVDPQDYHVRTVVQLRAADPTWYKPISTQLVFNNTEINVIDKTTTNDGNWFAYPYIGLTGPMTNPSITNNDTGEVIALTGTITAGNSIVIDLAYGVKTVTDFLSGANRISWVSASSNLATWSLRPGANSIFIAATGLTAASQCTLTYLPRYTGI